MRNKDELSRATKSLGQRDVEEGGRERLSSFFVLMKSMCSTGKHRPQPVDLTRKIKMKALEW